MISIIMAFYQRQALLDKTLESIKTSSIKDYELILVDDASNEPLVCDGAKIIRVNKRDKWYTCSGVAFNMGLREATGDVIVIQNPECYHMGDILSYVEKNIQPNVYLSFGCYAINAEETVAFHNGIMPILQNRIFTGSDRNGWYNHTRYRPVAYHFCSAIMRKDLDRMGGFDERYARGVAFDDDDLIRRIKNRGMIVKIIDEPYVIHQYHTHFEFENRSAWKEPHAINQNIFALGYDPNVAVDYSRNTDYYTEDSPEWDIIKKNYDKFYLKYNNDKVAVIPKNLHMIWLGGQLPAKYNRLIESWRKYHPDWNFKIWGDEDVSGFNMINKVAYDAVLNLGAKSDILRYEILYRHGGLYVDTDFECIKSFDDLLYLDFFGGGWSKTPCLANGLIGCKPNDALIGTVIREITGKQGNMDFRLDNILNVAGANFITRLYMEYIKDTTDKTILFPDSFFYPMPNSFREEIRGDTDADIRRIHSYIRPNTYCIHLWYTSWLPVVLPRSPILSPVRSSIRRGSNLNRHAGLSRRQLNRMHREQHSLQPRRQPKKPGR
jgi:mannosyltransferase OCH1-like enzyme/GT2 family glycosyltransferase